MYKIIFYEDENGRSEVGEYCRLLIQRRFNSKEDSVRFNKVASYMRMLSDKGFSIGQPYIKHITKEIWELRPLQDRILFAYWKGNEFIILHHFIKKTQRTPRREIEKAKKLLKKYKERNDLYEQKTINMG